MLQLIIFFTSFVMMLDSVFLVFRRLLIVLQTDQCVRDGPHLCSLNSYVGDWLMFIRCIFVRADASFPLF